MEEVGPKLYEPQHLRVPRLVGEARIVPTNKDQQWRALATRFLLGEMHCANQFYSAVEAKDVTEMVTWWHRGADLKLEGIQLKGEERMVVAKLALGRHLLEGTPLPDGLEFKHLALVAPSIVYEIAEMDLSRFELDLITIRLREIDTKRRKVESHDPYRPDLRIAIKLMKMLRHNAEVEYLSADHKEMHRLAIRAVLYADRMLPYSDNSKYRNCRSEPDNPAESYTHRLGRIRKDFPKPRRAIRPEEYCKGFAELGIGNCRELSRMAMAYLEAHGASHKRRLYAVESERKGVELRGDHEFVRLGSEEETSWIIDPWAYQVYPWSERGSRLKGYGPTGISVTLKSRMGDLKPPVWPLREHHRIVEVQVSANLKLRPDPGG